jgi:predicted nucleic acid-binding protein
VRFLDTTVLLRHLTSDDEEKAELSRQLLLRVEAGEEAVIVSPLVVFETIFTLRRRYRITPLEIRDAVFPLLQLPGIRLVDRQLYARAFEMFVDLNIPFADAYNAAFMEARGIDAIYTWDSDFDRIPGIKRMAPGGDANDGAA